MNHWNYRVVKYSPGWGDGFGVHEIYYNAQGKPDSRTLDPIVYGDTLEELQSALRMMITGTYRPMITDEELTANSHDKTSGPDDAA